MRTAVAWRARWRVSVGWGRSGRFRWWTGLRTGRQERAAASLGRATLFEQTGSGPYIDPLGFSHHTFHFPGEDQERALRLYA